MTASNPEGTEKPTQPIPKHSTSKSQRIPDELTKEAASMPTESCSAGHSTQVPVKERAVLPRQDKVNITRRDLPRPIRGDQGSAAH